MYQQISGKNKLQVVVTYFNRPVRLWSLLLGGSKLVHMFGQQQELIAGPLKVRNPGFIS